MTPPSQQGVLSATRRPLASLASRLLPVDSQRNTHGWRRALRRIRGLMCGDPSCHEFLDSGCQHIHFVQLAESHERLVSVDSTWSSVAVGAQWDHKPVARALAHSLPLPDVMDMDSMSAAARAWHRSNFSHVFALCFCHNKKPLVCM